MHIIITAPGTKNRALHLPGKFMLNGLTATALSLLLKNKKVSCSAKQLLHLFRLVRTYAAAHPEWKLVKIHSADGTVVEILL